MSSLETVYLGGCFFSHENTPEGHIGHFFCITKQVWEMVIMNDLEQPMLSYCMIYFESSEKSCSEQRRKL